MKEEIIEDTTLTTTKATERKRAYSGVDEVDSVKKNQKLSSPSKGLVIDKNSLLTAVLDNDVVTLKKYIDISYAAILKLPYHNRALSGLIARQPTNTSNYVEPLIKYASILGLTEVVQILLDYTTQHIRKKALEAAALSGKVEIVKCLLELEVNKYKFLFKETLLMLACQSGSLELVKYLIEIKGANINQVDLHGYTTLIYACQSGSLELVKYLIEKRGADIKQVDNENKSVLMYACQSGNLELVKYLIEKRGVDIKQVDNEGRSVLMYACQSGSLELVKYLIEKRGVDIKQVDNEGKSVLMYADKLKIIKYLIEDQSLDIKQVDNEGKTIMMYAAEFMSLEVVTYLIENGADINDRDNDGITALGEAIAFNDNLEVAYYLVSHPDATKAKQDITKLLEVACEFGTLKIVKYLVEKKGANIHQVNKDGVTTLMLAASNSKKLELLKYLVEEKGVDVTKVDKYGGTALSYIYNNNLALKYLIEKGVGLGKINSTKKLIKASEEGRLEEMQLWLEQGGDITKVDFKAALANIDDKLENLGLIKFWLEKGKGVNVEKTEEGSAMALRLASLRGNIKIVKFLLDNGVNINQADDDRGATALMYAIAIGQLGTAKFLLEQGADINYTDNVGYSSLAYAGKVGCIGVTKLLFEKGIDVSKCNYNNCYYNLTNYIHNSFVRKILGMSLEYQFKLGNQLEGYISTASKISTELILNTTYKSRITTLPDIVEQLNQMSKKGIFAKVANLSKGENLLLHALIANKLSKDELLRVEQYKPELIKLCACLNTDMLTLTQFIKNYIEPAKQQTMAYKDMMLDMLYLDKITELSKMSDYAFFSKAIPILQADIKAKYGKVDQEIITEFAIAFLQATTSKWLLRDWKNLSSKELAIEYYRQPKLKQWSLQDIIIFSPKEWFYMLCKYNQFKELDTLLQDANLEETNKLLSYIDPDSDKTPMEIAKERDCKEVIDLIEKSQLPIEDVIMVVDAEADDELGFNDFINFYGVQDWYIHHI